MKSSRGRPARRSTGIFITLEGGEGSGKTTHARQLCEWLTAQGLEVLHTREPGGTLLAERLRSILLDPSAETLAPETEAYLIFASRRQHVDHVIEPALAQGKTVVCDRFSDSTMAYQGYGRGLDLRVLHTMNDWATGKLSPQLTLLFDVPVAVGLRRRRSGAAAQNRLDREAEQFHRKVRTGFQILARREPRRIRVIDAAQSLESVTQTVEKLVLNWLTTYRSRTSTGR
ncbi:MAG: dTMP kinase [Nitrospira sp. SG-bin1]|nr:MAG: dTMP kinase [Nitrospira sp. SG-bin1]